MEQDFKNNFLAHLKSSIEKKHFVKLTLSKPSDKKGTLKNIYIRQVLIKQSLQLTFLYRYQTQDITKNHNILEALDILAQLLGDNFLEAHLFTLQADYLLLYNKKRKARLIQKKASQAEVPSKTHDKQKNRYISPLDNPYLQPLGITNKEGKILASGQKKYRQINKYIEIIDQLVQQVNLPQELKIVDMGSGKGYLTFALYDYLSQQKDISPKITGIELRPKLVEASNNLAESIQYDQLKFLAMNIEAFPANEIDILIALHACDIATDIAIAKGIKSEAEIIVVAPCCHKQVRKNMEVEGIHKSILRHGILLERQAELLTDSIRALYMEAYGYSTKVFEFISNEHTAKNVMIVGIKDKKNDQALEEINALKQHYGIAYHHLEKLL